MKLLPLCLLPLIIGLTCCKKSRHVVTSSASVSIPAPTLIKGDFLTTPGTYQHSDSKGNSTALAIRASGNSISWEITSYHPVRGGGSAGGSSSNGMTLGSSGAPWFIYVEEIDRFWMFNGSDQLDYYLRARDGYSSGSAVFGGADQARDYKVPDAVVRKLPENLRKLFPEPLPESPRPSI